jgi:4-hydroxy-tetrahydrodipicolinate synthase
MVYNIPARTGAKLFPRVLKHISGHSSFWSVKEASGSISEYQEFRTECPGVPLFSGDDVLTPFFAAAGCEGLVSVASNVWPEAAGLYLDFCLAGKTKLLFPVWKQSIESLFTAPNPVPAKVLLKEKGVIETAVLRPPLTEKELTGYDRLLEADEQISNWYKSNQ